MGGLLGRSFHLAHRQVLPPAGQTVQEQSGPDHPVAALSLE
jgi:hypothetical protein